MLKISGNTILNDCPLQCAVIAYKIRLTDRGYSSEKLTLTDRAQKKYSKQILHGAARRIITISVNFQSSYANSSYIYCNASIIAQPYEVKHICIITVIIIIIEAETCALDDIPNDTGIDGTVVMHVSLVGIGKKILGEIMVIFNE